MVLLLGCVIFLNLATPQNQVNWPRVLFIVFIFPVLAAAIIGFSWLRTLPSRHQAVALQEELKNRLPNLAPVLHVRPRALYNPAIDPGGTRNKQKNAVLLSYLEHEYVFFSSSVGGSIVAQIYLQFPLGLSTVMSSTELPPHKPDLLWRCVENAPPGFQGWAFKQSSATQFFAIPAVSTAMQQLKAAMAGHGVTDIVLGDELLRLEVPNSAAIDQPFLDAIAECCKVLDSNENEA
jgi:hypothetical protein